MWLSRPAQHNDSASRSLRGCACRCWSSSWSASTSSPADKMTQREQLARLSQHLRPGDPELVSLLQILRHVRHRVDVVVQRRFPNAQLHRQRQRVWERVLLQDVVLVRLGDVEVVAAQRRLVLRVVIEHRLALVLHDLLIVAVLRWKGKRGN